VGKISVAGTRHNRFMVVRKNGKRVRIPLRAKPEAAASVYFGVRFKDGTSVFMPRAIRTADGASRDLAELRMHACRVTGRKDTEIAAVETACVKCAREIPGCEGCGYSAALAKEAEAAAKPKAAAPAAEKKEAK
jgi:hypothetical protein